MSTITTLPNGSTIEKLADGTKISTSANGTILKVLPNGTKIQTTKEGVELIVRPDGTKEQKNGKGVLVVTYTDGRTVQTNPDGVRIEISADKKTRLQKNPDGSEILVRPDGSKLQKLADGTEIEVSVDGKKTKKVPAVKVQTAGEGAPPALPPSRALPKEVPPSIVSSTVKTKEAELAAVSSIAQAKREAERANQAERELENMRKKLAEFEARLAKSEDGESVSKAAQEHAKLIVRLETERDKMAEEKRQTEARMVKMKEQVDGAEALRADLAAKHAEALRQVEAKLAEQTKGTETLKAEIAVLAAELVAAKQLADAHEGKVLEMESTLTTLSSEKESLIVEKNALQEEMRLHKTRIEDIAAKGSTAAEKLAELRYQKATAEERANRYQEEVSQLKAELADLRSRAGSEGTALTSHAVPTDSNATTSEASATIATSTAAGDIGSSDEATALKADVEILMQAKESAEMEVELKKGELEQVRMELDQANATIIQLKEEITGLQSSSEAAQYKKRAEDAEKLVVRNQNEREAIEAEMLKMKLEQSQLRLKVALGEGPATQASSESSAQTSGASSSSTTESSNATVSAAVLEEEQVKLRSAQDEVDRLKTELTEARAKASKAELERDSERKHYEIKLNNLERENTEFLDKIKGQKEGGSGKSKSILGFGKKESKKAAMTTGETTEDIKSELAEAHHSLTEKTTEIEQLEEKLRKVAAEKDIELEELRSKLILAEEQLNHKTVELEQLRAKTSANGSASAASVFETEIEGYKTRLELAVTAKQSLEDQVKELERRVAEAGGSIVQDSTTDRLVALERQVAEKQAEVEALKQNIITSETDKEAALAEVASLRVTAQSAVDLQVRLNSVETELASLKAAAAAGHPVANGAMNTASTYVAPTPAVVPAVDTSAPATGTDFLSQLRAKQQTVTVPASSLTRAPSVQSMISPKGNVIAAPLPVVSSSISPKGTTSNPYFPTVGSSTAAAPKPGAVNSYLPKPQTTTTAPSYLNKTVAAPAAAAPASTSAANTTAAGGKSSKIADMMKRFEKN